MRVIFIRHGIAQPREDWVGTDFSRPLTDEGKEKLQKISYVMSKFVKIDNIISSNYSRAKETSEVLKKNFSVEVEINDTIALGADYRDFLKIFKANRNLESIMFVGHEPDFSEVISKITGLTCGSLKVKKASYIELDVDENFQGTLLNFMAPRTILNLSEFSFPEEIQ